MSASKKPTAAQRNANRNAMLANVTTTSFKVTLASTSAIAAVQAAGIDKAQQATTRTAFMIGALAGILHPTAETLTDEMVTMAKAVLAAAGKDAKALKSGQSRRTEAQERAYGLARYHWSRILNRAEVQSLEARGGARKPRPATAKPATAKPATGTAKPALPIATGKADVADFYKSQAALMLAYTNKNAKVVPPAFASLLQDFQTKLTALLKA